MLLENERLESLGNDINVITSPAHTFGTDALLLASFAAPKKHDTACDLGTGCGIIPLLWHSRGQGKQLYGVEIQEKGASQAQRGAILNGISETFTVLQADLKCLDPLLPAGHFDLISCNPPYKAPGAGLKSAREDALIARHETFCTVNDITASAARLLKSGGRLCLCMRPERLCELMVVMKAVNIEPKRLRLVSHRPGKSPWLILLEGRKNARPNMVIEPTLYMEDEGGTPSKELLFVYKEYKEQYI